MSRADLRSRLDQIAETLSDHWEPAALYLALAEESQLAAAEATLNDRLRADPSGLGLGRGGRLTRAGRRLSLRVLRFDRAECFSNTQIQAQLTIGGEHRVSWSCTSDADRAMLTISAARTPNASAVQLLTMWATRDLGTESGRCAMRVHAAELERLDMGLGLELGLEALLQLLLGYCSAFTAEEWEWDALCAAAMERRGQQHRTAPNGRQPRQEQPRVVTEGAHGPAPIRGD